MHARFRTIAAAAALLFALAGSALADEISPAGERLAQFYDGLQVETLWPAGLHVDWETGVPDGRPEHFPGRHTHCSAFVAAAAKRLGVYILRPPEHGQVLLANAQYDWLGGQAGIDAGWVAIADAQEAQRSADEGRLVVASYRSHRPDKPGHIALVRPGQKPADLLAVEGPDVIQAGSINYTRTSLALGFAGHPHAWGDHEVRFFAHDVPAQ